MTSCAGELLYSSLSTTCLRSSLLPLPVKLLGPAAACRVQECHGVSIVGQSLNAEQSAGQRLGLRDCFPAASRLCSSPLPIQVMVVYPVAAGKGAEIGGK